MKTGKTLIELATELERQSKSKKDYVADSKALSLVEGEGGKTLLSLSVNGNLGITETCHDQIGNELGIPRAYYQRMLVDSPELLRTNANHWLQKSDARRMVRVLDGNARAYLSDKFRPLDNFDLAEVALPALTGAGCRVESCEITEKRLYIKAVTERLTYELKPGDAVQAGIIISNSEIGCGSLSIEGLLHRLVCLNGMILPVRVRKTHIGKRQAEFAGVAEFFRDETRQADDRAFWLKVRDSITSMVGDADVFKSFVERFAKAQEDKIEKEVPKVIELAQKTWGLSEGEGNGILSHLIKGGDLNRFGLANAVTRYAQDVESYDRSTELERLGGLIVELPKTDWQRLAA